MKTETSSNTNVSFGGIGFFMIFALIVFIAGLMLGTYINDNECPDCVCSECPNTPECKPVPDMRTRIEKVEVCTQEQAFNQCLEIIQNSKDLDLMLED